MLTKDQNIIGIGELEIKGMSDKSTLSYTLFDRILDMYDDSLKRMLCVQYRMNQDIMKFSCSQLYENKLLADGSVAWRSLQNLEGVSSSIETRNPIILIDISNTGEAHEYRCRSRLDGGNNVANVMEVYLTSTHIRKLILCGVQQSHIGIITPYAAQVKKLSIALYDTWPQVEIGTVDDFQGREKEAIILSLVRSNFSSTVGFTAEKKRLNGNIVNKLNAYLMVLLSILSSKLLTWIFFLFIAVT